MVGAIEVSLCGELLKKSDQGQSSARVFTKWLKMGDEVDAVMVHESIKHLTAPARGRSKEIIE